MYVNSADGSIYIGDGENAPIKLITETNIGDYETGGSSEDDKYPYYPKKSELTLGNTIAWARGEWTVCHVTDTEAYLALNEVRSRVFFSSVKDGFEAFDATLNVEEKKCLKTYTSGSIFDRVTSVTFLPTEAQMTGGFAWFTSDNHRAIGANYITSDYDEDEYGFKDGRYVTSSGSMATTYNEYDVNTFRPIVFVDLTLYV